MGCCQCQPQWKEGGFDSAYVYSSGCCCLQEAGFEIAEEPQDPRWEECSKIIEEALDDADELVVSTTKKDCCGIDTIDYKESANKLNAQWVPGVNQKVAQFGYSLDAYQWTEMVYVSHGQYGGHVQPQDYLALRIKGPA
mmetsp:Transcript_12190/g.22838  ORF Transcript_12190/g.22838 Transcript_12190/m.22838 type:complete len:139 (+) Transcript_12190:78-494(+)